MSARPDPGKRAGLRSTPAALDRLVDWYETLSPQTLERIAEFYAHDARFKDPFNDVTGRTAIRRVFAHMFETSEAPRFRIASRVAGEREAFVTWTFAFRAARRDFEIRGATQLVFDARGKVVMHRDYWDAAEELYAKLPLVGALLRWLGRRFAAPA
jgi:steroid delta-isomerase